MGHFLAVSAFRDQSVQSVSDAIIAYAARFDWECVIANDGTPDDARDALIFPTADRWTVVLWPSYFNIHDIELCRDTSAALSTIVSTVHVYDGDYWTHALLDSGVVKDVFASMPHYFAESPDDVTRLATQWAGNPQMVADAIGACSDIIAPYFVHLPADGSSLDRSAFPDDEFPLHDIWVFTEFWRRLGIQYPDPPSGFRSILRLNRRFGRKLPTSEEFEL